MDIIMHNTYNYPTYSPLKVNLNILKKIHLNCSTEVPFYDHHGNIYTQHDDIVMRSAFGPTFSNFYTTHLENNVYSYKFLKKCLTYVDDILLFVNNTNELFNQQLAFQNNFVFSVTYKLKTNIS